MFNALELTLYKQHKYNHKGNERCDSQENNTVFEIKITPKEVMYHIM